MDRVINVGANSWNYVNRSLDNAAQTAGNTYHAVRSFSPTGVASSVAQGTVNQVKLGATLLYNNWNAILGR